MNQSRSIKRDLQLIRLIVSRNLTVRYKRSVIGAGWTLINPMMSSFVLWLVFSNSFGQRLSPGQQYAPYLMTGTLLNVFISAGIVLSAQSILDHATILTKIYVKPQIFTLSSSLSSLVNFGIGLIPLIFVCFLSGDAVSIKFPLVLIIAFCLVITVAGAGLFLSIFFIRYNDTQGVTTLLLSMLSFLTPLFYPITDLTPRMQNLVSLNPLTSYLNCFRWTVSDYANVEWWDWIYMVGTSGFVFVMGVYFFKKQWNRVIVMLA
jgi:ABC-2 type transport system permease protein